MYSNIKFSSNVYIVCGSSMKPYNNIDFIEQVFDYNKLKQIEKDSKFQTPNPFNQQQEYIISQSKICYYAKNFLDNKSSQYWILKKCDNGLKGVCKCQILQCEKILECRPEGIDSVKKEIEEFAKIKKADKNDMSSTYPVMLGFNRVIERYTEQKAYKLLANVDMERYIKKSYKKVTFLQGHENTSTWDNGANGAGTMCEKFLPAFPNVKEKYVEISEKQEKVENPMLKFQRTNNKNADNPFFKKSYM